MAGRILCSVFSFSRSPPGLVINPRTLRNKRLDNGPAPTRVQ